MTESEKPKHTRSIAILCIERIVAAGPSGKLGLIRD